MSERTDRISNRPRAIVLYGGFKIHCMKGIVQATLQNCVYVVVIAERQIRVGKMTKSKCFVTSN